MIYVGPFLGYLVGRLIPPPLGNGGVTVVPFGAFSGGLSYLGSSLGFCGFNCSPL